MPEPVQRADIPCGDLANELHALAHVCRVSVDAVSEGGGHELVVTLARKHKVMPVAMAEFVMIEVPLGRTEHDLVVHTRESVGGNADACAAIRDVVEAITILHARFDRLAISAVSFDDTLNSGSFARIDRRGQLHLPEAFLTQAGRDALDASLEREAERGVSVPTSMGGLRHVLTRQWFVADSGCVALDWAGDQASALAKGGMLAGLATAMTATVAIVAPIPATVFAGVYSLSCATWLQPVRQVASDVRSGLNASFGGPDTRTMRAWLRSDFVHTEISSRASESSLSMLAELFTEAYCSDKPRRAARAFRDAMPHEPVHQPTFRGATWGVPTAPAAMLDSIPARGVIGVRSVRNDTFVASVRVTPIDLGCMGALDLAATRMNQRTLGAQLDFETLGDDVLMTARDCSRSSAIDMLKAGAIFVGVELDTDAPLARLGGSSKSIRRNAEVLRTRLADHLSTVATVECVSPLPSSSWIPGSSSSADDKASVPLSRVLVHWRGGTATVIEVPSYRDASVARVGALVRELGQMLEAYPGSHVDSVSFTETEGGTLGSRGDRSTRLTLDPEMVLERSARVWDIDIRASLSERTASLDLLPGSAATLVLAHEFLHALDILHTWHPNRAEAYLRQIPPQNGWHRRLPELSAALFAGDRPPVATVMHLAERLRVHPAVIDAAGSYAAKSHRELRAELFAYAWIGIDSPLVNAFRDTELPILKQAVARMAWRQPGRSASMPV